MSGERVENFRVPLGPGVVDRHTPEAPFLAVARQLAVVAVHQERVLRSAARTFTRHEMLRHHIRGERGRIVTDLDLEIARRVTGIERADQRKHRVQDGLPAREPREVELQLPACGREIENAIFGQGRCERIGIAVVEAEGVAMQSVRNLISIKGELGQVAAHASQFRRSTSQSQSDAVSTGDCPDNTDGTSESLVM